MFLNDHQNISISGRKIRHWHRNKRHHLGTNQWAWGEQRKLQKCANKANEACEGVFFWIYIQTTFINKVASHVASGKISFCTEKDMEHFGWIFSSEGCQYRGLSSGTNQWRNMEALIGWVCWKLASKWKSGDWKLYCWLHSIRCNFVFYISNLDTRISNLGFSGLNS